MKLKHALIKAKTSWEWEVATAMNNFEWNLHRLMSLKGWTQKELAQKMGITQEHISRHMHGNKPSLDSLAKYAHAFDVSIADLLSDKLERDSYERNR